MENLLSIERPVNKNGIVNNREPSRFMFFNVPIIHTSSTSIARNRVEHNDLVRSWNSWKKIPYRGNITFEPLPLRLFSSVECIFLSTFASSIIIYNEVLTIVPRSSKKSTLSLCFEQSRLILIKRLLSQTSRGHTRITNECLVKSHMSSIAL